MKLRKRFAFDPIEWTYCKHIQLLAASADERTWWVKGGARCGVRLLAYFGDDDRVYTAPHLHDEALVESAHPGLVRDLFRRAADTAEIQRLEGPGVLPCFSVGEPLGHPVHKSGWYTKTERVLCLMPPWWAPDAQAFDIREGIYIHFPDDTFRLASRRDYYRFEGPELSFRRVLTRQGDLLFLSNAGSNCVFEGWGGSIQTRNASESDAEFINRHRINITRGTVTHHEHGTMSLPSEPWLAILEPGTSHPFAHVFTKD
jgi:hypothetical protein